MRTFKLPSREQAFRAAKWGTAGAMAIQLGAVAAVSGVDHMRKRRTPPTTRFPHLPPQTTQVGANSTTVYTFGRELYDAMLADIRAAKEYVYFECFIVKADETGHEFRDALIEAANRGVQTYVVMDTWGNFNQDPRFRHFPKIENLYSMSFPFVRPGIFTGRPHDKGRDQSSPQVQGLSQGFVDRAAVLSDSADLDVTHPLGAQPLHAAWAPAVWLLAREHAVRSDDDGGLHLGQVDVA